MHNAAEMIAAGWKAYCCILLFQIFAGEGLAEESHARANPTGKKLNGKKKENDRGRLLAGGCLLAVLELVSRWMWGDWTYMRAAVVCLSTSFVMYFVFRIPYLMSLVLSMLYYGLSIIAEFLSFVGVDWIFGGGYDVRLVVGALFLWCGILILKKMSGGKSYGMLTLREWRVLFISTFVTVTAFLTMVKIAWQNGGGQNNILLYLAIGILFIDFVVYCMANENMEREMMRREDEVFREKVKSEMAMYRSISEYLDKQRKRTHEFKNQMAAIGALAAAGQYGKLGEYIEKIDMGLRVSEDAIDTNHVIVNAILSTKYREAVEKGISFVLKINDLSKLHMEEKDIVIILSNLLDNAIEACSRWNLSEQVNFCTQREKVIKSKFVLEKDRIVISVKNSMEEKPVLKNGKFVTAKTKEANEHGFGIRNVMETVEKYGGQYAVDDSEGWFSFTIIMRNPDSLVSKTVENFPNL